MLKLFRIIVPLALCATIAPAASQDMPAATGSTQMQPGLATKVPLIVPVPTYKIPEEKLCPPGEMNTIKTLNELTAKQKLYIAALEKKIRALQGNP